MSLLAGLARATIVISSEMADGSAQAGSCGECHKANKSKTGYMIEDGESHFP